MRVIDADKAIEIIEEKQKELCPVGRYGRNYVYGSDREKYDSWEEIIDALEALPVFDQPEIVCCQDCVHHEDGCVQTGTGNMYVCPDDSEFFCKFGRKKDGSTTD